MPSTGLGMSIKCRRQFDDLVVGVDHFYGLSRPACFEERLEHCELVRFAPRGYLGKTDGAQGNIDMVIKQVLGIGYAPEHIDPDVGVDDYRRVDYHAARNWS